MSFSRYFMARSCLCYRSLSIGSSSCLYTGFFGRRSKTKYQCMAVFVVVVVGMRGLGKNVDFVAQSSVSRQIDIQHVYKNQLQHYAQKNLILPVYSCEWEGPPHARRFKCTVTTDGRTYQGSRFSSHKSTIKDAEHAAAKVALISLLPNEVQEIIKREILLLPFYKALT